MKFFITVKLNKYIFSSLILSTLLTTHVLAFTDIDSDGIEDAIDNCPIISNPGQWDKDKDSIGNDCDNCPIISNPGQWDKDKDGIGNDCDNCPVISNPGQWDKDKDGIGNDCDICLNDSKNDIDGDGVCGDIDNCPLVKNFSQYDHDVNGIGDACDDYDKDGVLDYEDYFKSDSTRWVKPRVIALPDLDDDKISEIAILSQDDTGLIYASIKNVATGTTIHTIPFNNNFLPIDFTVVPDLTNDGKPEIALLARSLKTGITNVYIKNSVTGALVSKISFDNTAQPIAFGILPDLDGNEVFEIAVLEVTKSNNKTQVRLKDSMSGKWLHNIKFNSFLSTEFLKVIPDLNGNGVPDLIVLGNTISNFEAVIKDGATGGLINNLKYESVFNALDVTLVNDVNKNSFLELALLGTDDINIGQLQLLDTATGVEVGNTILSSNINPKSMTVISDLNGNGTDELAILYTTETGEVKIEIKDSATNNRIKTLTFDSAYSVVNFSIPESINNNGDLGVTVVGIDHMLEAHIETKGIQLAAYNVIVILADDIGWEAIGTYGGVSYQTPNIDLLATNGIKFLNAHSSPKCTASRNKLMTGKYNFRNYKYFGYLDSNEKSFGHLMQEAGFKTMIAGKWQLTVFPWRPIDESFPYWGMEPQNSGFDEYFLWYTTNTNPGNYYWSPTFNNNGKINTFGADIYGPDLVNNTVLDFISKNKDERFFIYYPMFLPHPGYSSKEFESTPDQAMDTNNPMKAHVEYMDKMVGNVINHLSDLNLSQNTLVMFVGDNGSKKGLKQYLADGSIIEGGKGTSKDNGTHVPMIVSLPGTLPQNKIIDDMFNLMDIYPTLADFAKQEITYEQINGVNFWPRMLGNITSPREWIYIGWDDKIRPNEDNLVEYVFDKTWKLYSGGTLYNIKDDPYQLQPAIPKWQDTVESAAARSRLQGYFDAIQLMK
ncbi:MAG: sulfatase-like hydrolase/transferase [Methylococcales bacterium]|nr:sulfatase-like hydrolase/transferase [Methylococcales bacterium]